MYGILTLLVSYPGSDEMMFRDKPIKNMCVVCGTDEIDSERLASHYTVLHTQEILEVFDSMQPPEPNQPTKLPFSTCKKESFKPALWCKDSTHALPFTRPMPECETSPQEPVFVCSVAYCDASYNSILDLVQHVVQQHKEIPVNKIECRCSRCSVVLGVEDFIRHHDQNLCLMCHICKELFTSKQIFQSHVKECVENDITYDDRGKPYGPCQSCGVPTLTMRCKRKFCASVDDLFLCKICNKLFKSPSQLLRHQLTIHLQIREIECILCGSMYQREDHLKVHMESVHKDGRNTTAARYQCPICEFISFDIERAGRHIREHFKEHMATTQISSYCCTVCDFGCESKLDLYYHMYYEHYFADEPEELSCVMCDAFKTDSLVGMFNHSLEKHQIAYDYPLTLPADVKSFQCSTCSEEMRGTTAMLEHVEKHVKAPHSGTGKGKHCKLKKQAPCTPDKEGSKKSSSKQCHVCGRQFDSVRELLSHKATIHLRIGCFECLICGKTFGSYWSLKTHFKRVHKLCRGLPLNGGQYHCPLCAFISFDIEKVGRHIREHFKEHMATTQISSYCCTMCEFGSDNKQDLYYHMHYDHFTDKPEELSCVMCNEFKTDSVDGMVKHSLEKHQTVYDAPLSLPADVKSFQCLICQTQFRNVQGLLDHVTKHPGTMWEDYDANLSPVINQIGRFIVQDRMRQSSHRICFKRVSTSRKNAKNKEDPKGELDVEKRSCNQDSFRRKNRSTANKLASTAPGGELCEICDYEASSKSEINKHFIDIHLGDGPYTCEHCNNVYQTAESLLEHLNSLSTTVESSANNELTTYDSNHDGDSVDETEDAVDSDENSWSPGSGESDSGDDMMSDTEAHSEKYFD